MPKDDQSRPVLRLWHPGRGSAFFLISPLASIFTSVRNSSASVLYSTDTAQDVRAFAHLHWGGYLAIQTESDLVAAYCDAGGHMPCYFARLNGGCLLASDATLLAEQAEITTGPDWQQVEEQLLFPGHFTAKTALRGVEELLPGQMLVISRGNIGVETLWQPHPTDNLYPVPAYEESIHRIHNALDQVQRSIAEAFPKALATVSGGLDSSIVASGYAEQGADPTFLTFYTDDPIGDERPYARAVAEASGAHLIEMPYAVQPFDQRSREAVFLPRPTHRFIGSAINSCLSDIASSQTAATIVNGYGGDNVFASLSSIRPAVDHIFSAEGLGAVGETAKNLQKLTGASYFALAHELARYALKTHRKIRRRPVQRDARFLKNARVRSD